MDKICGIHSEDIRSYIFTILDIYINGPKRRFGTDNHYISTMYKVHLYLVAKLNWRYNGRR
jgi:hypothetical protein